MADPWDIVGGSSRSGDPWAAVGGSGSSWADAERKRAEAVRKARAKARKKAAKKAKEEKEGRSLFGLAENLVHDVGDAAMGIPAGLRETAKAVKAVGHDGKEFFSGGGDYKLDDLAAATWDAMKWTYEPLADGDFAEFGRRVYEHPLGPVLDALTIVTLGAGGTVKGAKAVSDVGRGASLAQRVTGGTVRRLADGENAADALTKLRAGREFGSKRVGAVSADGRSILEPAPRLITSKAQRNDERLSSPLSRHAKNERVEGDGMVRVGDYAENPIRRLQQRAWDALSETIPGWSERRIAHATRKAERNVSRRNAQLAGFGTADAVLRKEGAVSPEVGREVWNRAQGKDAAAEVERLERERDALMREDDGAEKEAALLRSVIGKRKGDRARDRVAEEISATNAKITEANEVADGLLLDEGRHAEAVRYMESEGWRKDGGAQEVDANFLLRDALVEGDDGVLRPFADAVEHDRERGADGRQWEERAVDLAEDIGEFGYDRPVNLTIRRVNDENRFVVSDGVARVLAAQVLERKSVPARIADIDPQSIKRQPKGNRKRGVAKATYEAGRWERNVEPTFTLPEEWGAKVNPSPEPGSSPMAKYKTRQELAEALAKRIERLGERRAILQRAMIDPDDALTMAEQMVKARADVAMVLPQIEATIRVQRAIAEGRLTGKERALVNQLVRVLAPVAHDTDRLLKEGAELRGAKGPSEAKRLTDEQKADGRFNVPHTADRSNGARGAKQGAQSRRDPARPSRPDSSRRDTGYNDRFGLDAAKPENVLATHKAAELWTQTMRSWRTAVDAMRPVPDGGLGDMPPGYKRVPQGVAARFYDNARAFLDDEAPVIFGEGSPVLEQMQETLVAGLGSKFASGPQMVPTKVYDKLMREMQPRKRLPLFDQVTGVWRMSVVSPLRPAFVVDNIVGQSALLLVANSSLRGLRSMMQYAGNKELREFMRPYMGAVEGSGQSAVLGRETTEMLRRNHGRLAGPMATARNLNEGLGRFSQAITDDPFRRMAFAQEALPPARKMVKQAKRDGRMVETPEGTRPYVMQDALQELLADEQVLDRIERKVLGDLVDFDDLTATERDYIRRVLPFYSWIKGSSKLTIQLALNNPLYANMLARVGAMGAEKVQEGAGGPLPDYMLGLLGLGNGDGGLDKAVTTAQFNPFITPADTAQQFLTTLQGELPDGQSAFGPENPLSAANPLVKMGAAALTKKDPFTGRDATWWSVMGGSFPQRQFLPGGAAYQEDGVFSKGLAEELAKYLGIPVRNVDVEKAIDMQINPWQSQEFSTRAIDTRTEKGEAELAALRARLRREYGRG